MNKILPIDAVVMAGGKGVRLRPLTENEPKPMLKIEDKPMIAYNIEKIIHAGIKNIYVSVYYLKEQIIEYVKKEYGAYNIKFIEEKQPLGTIGSISIPDDWENNDILVVNADIMSDLDIAEFYSSHQKSDAQMSLAATNLKLKIPYGVLSVTEDNEFHFEEKPTIDYCATAGIYLMKKDVIQYIPKNEYYDATDLIVHLIDMKAKMNKFLINGGWIDVGSHQTYLQAQKMDKRLW